MIPFSRERRHHFLAFFYLLFSSSLSSFSSLLSFFSSLLSFASFACSLISPSLQGSFLAISFRYLFTIFYLIFLSFLFPSPPPTCLIFLDRIIFLLPSSILERPNLYYFYNSFILICLHLFILLSSSSESHLQ